MTLTLKRAYEAAEASDGFRVLVDRLWPRGVSKEQAAIDLWAKDTAPSPDLRRAWHAATTEAEHAACADRYRAELANEDAEALEALAETLRDKKIVTLVYASRDEKHNHAVVLEEALRSLLSE